MQIALNKNVTYFTTIKAYSKPHAFSIAKEMCRDYIVKIGEI